MPTTVVSRSGRKGPQLIPLLSLGKLVAVGYWVDFLTATIRKGSASPSACACAPSPPESVQFADGRKATNLDRSPYDPEGQAPDRPVLNQHGGGGGGAAWDMEHWVWPLPPAGPFAFVCAWAEQRHRGVAGRDRRRIDPGSGPACRDLLAPLSGLLKVLHVTLGQPWSAGRRGGRQHLGWSAFAKERMDLADTALDRQRR
jgi:hypothetical protein